jgi:hypothetical protein
VFSRLQRILILSATTLVVACDPNVVIGARWGVAEEGGLSGAGSGGVPSGGAGSLSGGAGTGAGGSEMVIAGAGEGGAAGAPVALPQWCATAPWVNTPVRFVGDGDSVVPAGNYVITYVSGAQIHDRDIGYEVTRHYYAPGPIEAGHHVFSGESPESASTKLWLDQVGILAYGGTIAEVEAANRGHTWPLEHAGGELFITLYDDDYHDNLGPGSRFCISATAP